MLVRRFLHGHGYRYTLHNKKLPGRPDIVLPRYCTIVFIHGCFWHGHNGCRYFTIPKTRTLCWADKIATNQANDAKAIYTLKEQTWKVIEIWECDLKKDKVEETLGRLIRELR